MTDLKRISIQSLGFIASKSWLVLFLIPVLYLTLPTSSRHFWPLQAIDKLSPAGVQSQVRETSRSVATLVMTGAFIYASLKVLRSSLEE